MASAEDDTLCRRTGHASHASQQFRLMESVSQSLANGGMTFMEIKASATFLPDFLGSINRVALLSGNTHNLLSRMVIHESLESPWIFKDSKVIGYPWIKQAAMGN
jgi:hypothetical protein